MNRDELKLGRVAAVHPSARDKALGARSHAELTLWTAGGQPRRVLMEEDHLIRLIAESSKVLAIMRGIR